MSSVCKENYSWRMRVRVSRQISCFKTLAVFHNKHISYRPSDYRCAGVTGTAFYQLNCIVVSEKKEEIFSQWVYVHSSSQSFPVSASEK